MHRIWIFGLLLARLAADQQQAPAVSFETASIKPVEKATSRRNLYLDPVHARYLAHTLQMLIGRAYDLRRFPVTGPAWTETKLYDVTATIPQGASA